ncbi:hypothetical protein DPMN_049689 [Dreissena polymorpha]|uniref:Uncharacterized protein n=1 Tax=Dreissena polymorpha TaxID=45954 RepID=A0A9D4CG18_DREPO|nr:hypothetical protein DPMN_049689 [Dreissena polymorpha]
MKLVSDVYTSHFKIIAAKRVSDFKIIKRSHLPLCSRVNVTYFNLQDRALTSNIHTYYSRTSRQPWYFVLQDRFFKADVLTFILQDRYIKQTSRLLLPYCIEQLTNHS